MGAAITLWNVIGKAQQALVITIVPLHRHLNTNAGARYAAISLRWALSYRIKNIGMQNVFAFIDKLNTRGYAEGTADLDRTFSIKEVKGIPTEEEIEAYLTQALEDVVSIGIVRAPEMAS